MATPPLALSPAKAELRRALGAARHALGPEARHELAVRATFALGQLPAFRAAKTIALFAAIGDELDPAPLDELARSFGARVAYPRVAGSDLVFGAARPGELVPAGRFHIPEPLPSAPLVPVESIRLFVVPGLGFSERGERLGYGKGYYDRVLRTARQAAHLRGGPPPLAVGLAFSCQLLESLPVTPDDEPIDALATEHGIFFTRSPDRVT